MIFSVKSTFSTFQVEVSSDLLKEREAGVIRDTITCVRGETDLINNYKPCVKVALALRA